MGIHFKASFDLKMRKRGLFIWNLFRWRTAEREKKEHTFNLTMNRRNDEKNQSQKTRKTHLKNKQNEETHKFLSLICITQQQWVSWVSLSSSGVDFGLRNHLFSPPFSFWEGVQFKLEPNIYRKRTKFQTIWLHLKWTGPFKATCNCEEHGVGY